MPDSKIPNGQITEPIPPEAKIYFNILLTARKNNDFVTADHAYAKLCDLLNLKKALIINEPLHIRFQKAKNLIATEILYDDLLIKFVNLKLFFWLFDFLEFSFDLKTDNIVDINKNEEGKNRFLRSIKNASVTGFYKGTGIFMSPNNNLIKYKTSITAQANLYRVALWGFDTG